MSLNKPNRCVDTRSITRDESTLTITSPIQIVLDEYVSGTQHLTANSVICTEKKIDIQFDKQIMLSENINFIFLCYIIVSVRKTFQSTS
jgi:hypothetical protein